MQHQTNISSVKIKIQSVSGTRRSVLQISLCLFYTLSQFLSNKMFTPFSVESSATLQWQKREKKNAKKWKTGKQENTEKETQDELDRLGFAVLDLVFYRYQMLSKETLNKAEITEGKTGKKMRRKSCKSYVDCSRHIVL